MARSTRIDQLCRVLTGRYSGGGMGGSGGDMGDRWVDGLGAGCYVPMLGRLNDWGMAGAKCNL